MKIRNAHRTLILHAELDAHLAETRRRRNFEANAYIRAKTTILNGYMARFGLKACVVAVSGGIDSAIVLGLARAAAREPNSPIRRIVAVLLPAFGSEGVTNQDAATERGREVCAAFAADPLVIDLSAAHDLVANAAEGPLGIAGGAWARGQLVPYLRTPTLYYATSLLAQEGFPAILLGTTNRDEGGYLGYFGKASDGMVDVQLISDLHKSEVRAVAVALGVPASVLDAVPTGDMFDAKVDEEVFGAPYDFVELYQDYLTWPTADRAAWRDELGMKARAQFDEFAANLEAMHRYNGHKYLGRSPAVHLDVLESAIPGGWDNGPAHNPLPAPSAAARSRFVGAFELDAEILSAPGVPCAAQSLDGGILSIDGVLSGAECEALRRVLDAQEWVPVGRDGYRQGFDTARDVVGSWRASAYSEAAAAALWRRVAPALPTVRVMDDDTPTDWEGYRVWRPIGLNPLLRFIRYAPGGLLLPHYDAPYVFDARRRTLMSLVLYLDDVEEGQGGAFRVVRDSQADLPLAARIYADWDRPAAPAEIRTAIAPCTGLALAFDHRILHDSAPFEGTGAKLALRTDVVFERCDGWAHG